MQYLIKYFKLFQNSKYTYTWINFKNIFQVHGTKFIYLELFKIKYSYFLSVVKL